MVVEVFVDSSKKLTKDDIPIISIEPKEESSKLRVGGLLTKSDTRYMISNIIHQEYISYLLIIDIILLVHAPDEIDQWEVT